MNVFFRFLSFSQVLHRSLDSLPGHQSESRLKSFNYWSPCMRLLIPSPKSVVSPRYGILVVYLHKPLGWSVSQNVCFGCLGQVETVGDCYGTSMPVNNADAEQFC